jgi:RNA polymerase sigma-70 factor, ECF subfamily
VSAENGAEAPGDFAQLADPYRRELLAHCYRMVGSLQDAEDLVQDTLLRAWRAYEDFDGRSSLRTWLYRIATNACLTALGSSHRRVLPSGLGAPASDSENAGLGRLDSVPWLDPVPTAMIGDQSDDPASIVSIRDSTRLALVAAFQTLPVRQRAVLLLVDVVGVAPAEAAGSLGITVTAARSLLQRARATLAEDRPAQERVVASPDLDAALLQRYLDALENGEIAALAGLLRSDVEYEMPPIPTWFLGRDAVLDHHARRVFRSARRAIPTSANGFPAAATYIATADGSFAAHGIQVIEARDGLIARVTVFLGTALFPKLGLPMSLPAPDTP